MRRIVFGAWLLILAACDGAQTAGQVSAGLAGQSPDQVVAEVGGRKITLRELDEKWQSVDPAEAARVTQLVYQQRRDVLDRMLGDLLLDEAAKAAGLPTEQYLTQQIEKRVQPVSDADIQQFFNTNKDRAEGRTLDQLRGPIKDFLENQREQQARTELLAELKKTKGAALRVSLEPPRATVELNLHDPALGPVTAPVTIIEFSDYQCPFCARVGPTLTKLRATYGDRVRIVFKDFPLPNHPQAPKAAEAAHCAGEQGKYWEMHDRMFADQQALEVPALKKQAAGLGLDAGKFDQCLDSGKFAEAVRLDMRLGSQLGVASTPTLFINGRPVVGAQSFEYFQSIIDEELARVK